MPLLTMCETSEGNSESVRRRSQPNSRPSGSTRMMCAGSKWAAAKASELTIQADDACPSGRPASRRAGRETPAPRPAAPARRAAAGCSDELAGSRTISITCFMPCGLDAELADRDRQHHRCRARRARRVASRPGGSPAPARPPGPAAPPPPAPPAGRSAKNAPRTVSMCRDRAATRRPATRAAATSTARKIRTVQPGMADNPSGSMG